MHGHVDAFTIVFQPGGVSTLFSVPAEELTDGDFDGEAVVGRGLGELLRRLGDVSSFAERARVADAYLCAKLPTQITSAACPTPQLECSLAMDVFGCQILHIAQGWGSASLNGAFAMRKDRWPRKSSSMNTVIFRKSSGIS